MALALANGFWPAIRLLRRMAKAAMSLHINAVPSWREAGLYPLPQGQAADIPARWPFQEASTCVEKLIRPIALTRKNARFAGHDEGGQSWGRIASLIVAAKINGVEPFAYIKAPLVAVATGYPQVKIENLRP